MSTYTEGRREVAQSRTRIPNPHIFDPQDPRLAHRQIPFSMFSNKASHEAKGRKKLVGDEGDRNVDAVTACSA